MKTLLKARKLKEFNELDPRNSLGAAQLFFVKKLEDLTENLLLLDDNDNFNQLRDGYYLRMFIDASRVFVYVICKQGADLTIYDSSMTISYINDSLFMRNRQFVTKSVFYPHSTIDYFELHAMKLKQHLTHGDSESEQQLALNEEEQAAEEDLSQKRQETKDGSPSQQRGLPEDQKHSFNSFPADIISDHAYRSSKFSIFNSQKQLCFSINAGTWNLQNLGHSDLSGAGYSNNPYNIDESVDAWFNRKKEQIKRIEQFIIAGDKILFLQEIDLMHIELICTANRNPEEIVKLRSYQAILFELLQTVLKKHNYAMSVTERSKGAIGQQPLATLYDAKLLDLQRVCGVLNTPFPTGNRSKYRGYETVFWVNGVENRTTIVATNVHLAFDDVDYQNRIMAYQNDIMASGHFHIMGGDINHEDLATAIGDGNEATSFISVRHLETNTRRLINHDLRSNSKKSIDRFFVVAPRQYSVMVMTNIDRSEQVIINSSGNAVFIPSQDTSRALTLIGREWARPESLILKLYTQFEEEKEILRKNMLLNELLNVANIFWDSDNIQLQLNQLGINLKQLHTPISSNQHYNPRLYPAYPNRGKEELPRKSAVFTGC